ncbi:MAG: type IX secretion system membrane protein PorP/SprF [Saprospiraceae bacterium]|nr:type IX secretion system membrane protein PorP/SprF [Saprospiraceae bacterium]
MKVLLQLIVLLLTAATGFAQQAAQYSMYNFNQLNFNPAYAGLEQSLSLSAGLRRQWTGLEGSPSTQYLTAHMPLYIAGGGVGFIVENDELGAERLTSASVAFNYQLEATRGVWSLGVGGGLVQRSLDGAKLRTPGGIYTEPGGINHEDDLLPLGVESGSTPTFHAGLYFQSEKLDAGIAVRHLTAPKTPVGELQLELSRAYFFHLGLHFELSSSLSLHPSVMIQSDVVQTQGFASILFSYNDNISAGLAFRGYSSNSLDAAVIMAGVKLSEKLSLGYAFDLTLSGLSAVNNGSHEIALNYNLGKLLGAGRPPRIIYNPRSN